MGKLVHEWQQRWFTRWWRALEKDETDERELLVAKNAEWLSAAALSVSRLIGVLLAFCLDNTMAAVSQCVLGSHLLTDAVEASLDPLLERIHLPTVDKTPVLNVAVHTIFFLVGMRRVLVPAVFGVEPQPLPALLKVLLSPLRAFEFLLSKFVINK